MGRKKARKAGAGKFVQLTDFLLKTLAWRSLTPAARSLYVELKYLFNGQNNGQIFMSWRDAAQAIGVMTPQTAAKAFTQLEDRGFIKVRLKGSFANKTRLSSHYILTEYPYNDANPSKDYVHWRPSGEEKRRLQKSIPPWLKKRADGRNFVSAQFEDEADFRIREAEIPVST